MGGGVDGGGGGGSMKHRRRSDGLVAVFSSPFFLYIVYILIVSQPVSACALVCVCVLHVLCCVHHDSLRLHYNIYLCFPFFSIFQII